MPLVEEVEEEVPGENITSVHSLPWEIIFLKLEVCDVHRLGRTSKHFHKLSKSKELVRLCMFFVSAQSSDGGKSRACFHSSCLLLRATIHLDLSKMWDEMTASDLPSSINQILRPSVQFVLQFSGGSCWLEIFQKNLPANLQRIPMQSQYYML